MDEFQLRYAEDTKIETWQLMWFHLYNIVEKAQL